jgi:hypothetical protein
MRITSNSTMMFQFISSNVMVVISFGAFSATVLHAIKHKTLIYWRLTLATAIMTTVYIIQIIWLSHWRHGHAYNSLVWSWDLVYNVFYNTWPYTALPTLLYTWQYYELVDRVANPNRSCCAFWLRAAFVAVASFGIVIVTLIYDVYAALAFWYTTIVHFDLK